MFVNCPICGSEERFNPKTRVVASTQFGRLLELYIECTHCPYRQLVRYTTNDIESINGRINRYKKEAARQVRELDGANDVLFRKLEELDDEITQEYKILELILNEYNDQTD